MYSKLFARITESSLMEEPIGVRYTFVMMLAIADPEGYVIGTDIAIARRLNMPLKEFCKCLQVLTAPDKNSNSKLSEGRRVVPSDGERGYRLVNFRLYRDMKDQDEKREYMREYMREYRRKPTDPLEPQEDTEDVNSVNICKTPLADVTHEEEDAEEDAEEEEIPLTPFFPEPINTSECRSAWTDWIRYKHEIKKPYKSAQSESKSLKRLSQLGPKRMIAAIEFSIGQGWSGIYEDKTGAATRPKPASKVATDEDMANWNPVDGGQPNDR